MFCVDLFNIIQPLYFAVCRDLNLLKTEMDTVKSENINSISIGWRYPTEEQLLVLGTLYGCSENKKITTIIV